MKGVLSTLHAIAILGLLFLANTVVGRTQPTTDERAGLKQPFTPADPFAQVGSMGRGVNVLGYDPVWRAPQQARFQPRHFKVIHDAGFNTVRIVLQSFAHMSNDDRLDSQWLATLDTMVAAALEAGLVVVLDEHDFEFCAKDAAACRNKLNAFWSQVAPRYKDTPNRVVFELLNEPHGVMTPQLWNTQLRETLAIVRASNPRRNVIVGPGHWNGLEDLPALELPNDPNIIVTFHYYHPMTFTHQGASWVSDDIKRLSGVTWGSDADYALLNREFDLVQAWSKAHRRPIFLGEFGAYDKAAMEDRARWDAAVSRAAEARGFSWSYWEFEPDFKLYDVSEDQWVVPILHALIPQQANPIR